MPPDRLETAELYARWFAMVGLVRLGLDIPTARDIVGISLAQHTAVTTSTSEINQLLSLDLDRAVHGEHSTGAHRLILAFAIDGNLHALTWLRDYLEREGKGEPTYDERIQEILARKSFAEKPTDVIALDKRLSELQEERRLSRMGGRRDIEEISADALAQLDLAMDTGTAGEKRKAAKLILDHAIAKAKEGKVQEALLQVILPTIRRFSEEMVRLTEKRVPEGDREAWKVDVQEQLRQLLVAMGSLEP